MKRILATTAIVALTAMPVFAQSGTTDQTTPSTTQSSDVSSDHSGAKAKSNADITMDLNGLKIGAADLIGKTVYMLSEESPDAGIVDSIEAPSENWENVGDVNDVILSEDGQITSVTLDVGGFLGMGGKELSTSMDELKMVTKEGSDSEYFVVFTGNRAALEEREALDRQSVTEQGGSFFADNSRSAPTDTTAGSDTMASDTDANAGMNAGAGVDADATTSAEAGDIPQLSGDERAALTAEDLEGVAVYDTADEHVGEISDIVLSSDGRVEHVIVDVGGFLGLGEKPVAVSFDEIDLSRDPDGVTNALQATTSLTVEEMENMKEWKG